MSACVSKKIQGQGLSIEEENMVVQKQGIVTILGSNHDAPTSLRRTLSADMSSKTWLSQNGFSPMKKTASSEELSHSLIKSTAAGADSSSSSEEDNCEDTNRFQIWNTIQKEQPQRAQFDAWSSILAQKANEERSKLTTTPYVHPLVRRSKSCLSEKSLEICTESLGSETGSDGFSSYSPSETEDSEEEKEEEEEEEEKVQITNEEELQVPKYNYAEKKSLPRSFPPPLPSLHMRSHRDNGRLFLQAVSVPSQNKFCAQRENGRLVLTFSDEEVAEEEEEEFEEGDDEAEEVESVIEEAPMLLSSGIGLALMMNEPIGLLGDANKCPKWSEKFNDVINFKDVDVVQVQHSPLPPRPRQQHSPLQHGIHKKFNAYEYYWRTKPKAKAAPASNTFTFQHNNYSSLENSLKSCKDSRRSFLFWEPYCIAT